MFCHIVFCAFCAKSTALSQVISPNSPLVTDWLLQDGKTAESVDADYLAACQKRRDERLVNLKSEFPKIVFVKHFDLGGSHYAYTEAQSDAQAERNFVPGSALCILELKTEKETNVGAQESKFGEYVERTLLEDKNGVIRDPAISFDGKIIVFSWKKSDRLDDYHLYDYNMETGQVRQLTFGLGYADVEPCLLPNCDIIFGSTRCVQIVDCWWTEVSNLYRCDKDGNQIRRLSYDQVHSNFPTLLEDGRVIYTRWDYNDRGQIFPQALFQTNADGTAQTELYGNNSWFPTTLLHSRGIPASGGKIVSIFSGHHNRQYGKLGIIDPSKGRQENQGTQLIAPIRETKADRIDAWGQNGDRFAYPFPINDREFLVSYNSEFLRPLPDNASDEEKKRHQNQHTTRTPFGIYWFDADGNRELLFYDASISSHQPIPLIAREFIPIRELTSNLLDHSDWQEVLTTPDSPVGTYMMQDVYFGPGLEGIERGKAKTLRVIALDFRSVGIGANTNHGPSGGALVSTPIAISHGCWDVKIPLGDAPIYEDGSASFQVPTQTPLYFQVLDENGLCIQTMRSWSTLQQGENFSCFGCHEDKNVTFQQNRVTTAMREGPKPLKPFYGKPRGFSFAKEIQPILDEHCIKCHKNNEKAPPFRNQSFAKGKPVNVEPEVIKPRLNEAILATESSWYYTTNKPSGKWMHPNFFQEAQKYPRSSGGFGNRPGKPDFSTLWNTSDLWVWTELDLPENWVPQPLVMQYYHDEDVEIYVNGVAFLSAPHHNSDYEYAEIPKKQCGIFKPGRNIIAAHVLQTSGGQGFDLGIWTLHKNDLESN
ncbi:MAG: hypothetical protein ACRCUY_13805, partial [Thermoguttaceae bacterium]